MGGCMLETVCEAVSWVLCEVLYGGGLVAFEDGALQRGLDLVALK